MELNEKRKILTSFADCLNNLHCFHNPFNISKYFYIIL